MKLKDIRFACLFFLFSFNLFTYLECEAQDVTEESSHFVRQYKGSEGNIAKYFQRINRLNSDTLLAIFVPPMGCPRCEGTINMFIKKYNEYSNNNSIIFVFGEQSKSLEEYLKKRDYNADLIVVEKSRKILESFKFSSGNLSVPFFLNIDASNGKLLNYSPSLGINLNDKEIKRFLKTRENLLIAREQNKDENNETTFKRIKHAQSLNEFVFNQNKEIELPQGINQDNISNLRLSENGTSVSFINDLNSNVILFDLKEGHPSFVRSVPPTAEDENRFINSSVSDTVKLLLKKLGIINTMYLNAVPIDVEEIVVSASLPKVEMKKVDGEESVAYYNKATLIKVSKNNFREYLYLEDSAFLVDSTKSYLHKNFFVINDHKDYRYLFPIHKGWPVVGNDKAFLNYDNTNPLYDKFYEQAPLFAVFNSTGRFIKEIGILDEIYEKLRVGYYYSTPMIKSIKNSFLIGDKYTGNVDFYKKDTIFKTFRFFDNSRLKVVSADNKIDQLNSLKHQLDEKLLDFTYSKNEEVFGIIDTKKGLYLAKSNKSQAEILNSIYSKTSEEILYKSFIRNISGERLAIYLFIIEGHILKLKSGYIDI